MGNAETPRRDSVARMRNVDHLPRDFRLLTHEFGYAVYHAWLRGWSERDIREKAKNGVFAVRAHGRVIRGHG